MAGNLSVGGRSPGTTAAVLAVRPDPVADAGFVGRDTELAELLGLLTPDRGTSKTSPDATGGSQGGADVVVVSAVAGAPGVGKTALAQAAARAAVAHGWFPGGAVSVNVHGYDPDPALVIWPAQLYVGLLRSLGVPGEQVPPTESEQATVYHQLLNQLAAAGRPVLLVVDNVADPDQVAELVPRGVGGHRVLITSRHTLGQLPDARLLDLHILEPAAAIELLTLKLRSRRAGDGRSVADPAAATRLVELCGRLPLAVQIVAELLGDEPDRPLADAAQELADEAHRLHALKYERKAVRAAFELSYRRLDPPVAELFGWLAAVPGADVGLEVAAVVADRPQPQVRAELRGLCRAHLLEQHPGLAERSPRWRMHDLIRLYATEKLTADRRAAGFARVLGYYRHTADAAERRFTALPANVAAVPAGFDTRQQAMAWVLSERAGLVACVTRAVDTHPEDAMRLATDLAPFLDQPLLRADWVIVASAAVRAATGSADSVLAASAWGYLGNALEEVRRFEEAIAAHRQAGDIFREVGDRRREGAAWNNLGLTLRQVRRFEEAITAHQRARDIFREVGDRHDEGKAWNNLGLTLRQVRRFEEAITAHERAGAICRETGDRHGEGTAWNNLGSALREVRRFEEAITAHQQAGDIFRETGDRHSEGTAWNNLGLALRQVRRFEEAITAHQQDLAICRETGDRHGEGTAWNNLGLALREVRRFEEAITAHERAGDIFRETGDRHGEGSAWNNLGLALRQVRRFEDAIAAYQHDIAICAELGNRYGQAQTLGNLGLVHAELEHPERARRAWTDAIELYTAVGTEDEAGRVRQRIVDLDR